MDGGADREPVDRERDGNEIETPPEINVARANSLLPARHHFIIRIYANFTGNLRAAGAERMFARFGRALMPRLDYTRCLIALECAVW